MDKTYTIEWVIADKILCCRQRGRVTVRDIVQAHTDLRRLSQKYGHPVHIIFDLHDVTHIVPPSDINNLSITSPQEGVLSVLLGGTVKVRLSVVTFWQIRGIPHETASSLTQAVALIQDHDPSATSEDNQSPSSVS